MGKKNKRNEGVVFATISAVVLFAAVIGGVLYSQYTPKPKEAPSEYNVKTFEDGKEWYREKISSMEADIVRLPEYSNERQNARKELELVKEEYSDFLETRDPYRD